MRKKITLSLLLFLCLALSSSDSYARTHYVFKDAPPVEVLDDRKPSPVPQKNDFDLIDYSISAAARLPVVRFLDPRRTKRSQDVNSMDEVPASTWYTPRLGYQKMTNQEIMHGLENIGPPQTPFKIVKSKKNGTALGFVIQDQRGYRYLVKFDVPEYPYSESTANVVANRLYWAFGYNTPEDYLFMFTDQDYEFALKNEEDQNNAEIALFTSTPDENGMYRATASLYIDGEILGYIPEHGTRRGDINDQIPHENLRVLRAQKVFCAWLNNSGIRGDNTLDSYHGEAGQGYTMHYMLDFGETLGAHGLIKTWPWDGFEHIFSFEGVTKRVLTLGMKQPWEDIQGEKDDQRKYYEAEAFDPSKWAEVVQYTPIRLSQPDDDYWATKILGALTRENLESLFTLAKHPNPDIVNDMIHAMMQRRQKILDHYLFQVTPLESDGVMNGALQLEDMAKTLLDEPGTIAYEVKFFNHKNRKVAGNVLLENLESNFKVQIPQEAMTKAKGYLRLEITMLRNGKKVPRPAEFHVLRRSSGEYKLVGIVH